MTVTLDDKDRILLNQLQEDARMTSAELGKLVNLSPSGVQKRMHKLEDNGLIKKYTAVIDRKNLGFDLLVFVQVTLQGHTPQSVADFDEAIQTIPEVLECHRVTGIADYLLKVVVRNHEHLDNLLMTRLLAMPSVERVNSNLVLKEVKETANISLIVGRGQSNE
ncbi:MAG: Lrp/AsnC family transcriptional regulator [Candidatus Promineifilaceae bacterium]|nr:Lrp/AsnC family transcriptional regulator [Candidatus Promineifilaceae bacterium]